MDARGRTLKQVLLDVEGGARRGSIAFASRVHPTCEGLDSQSRGSGTALPSTAFAAFTGQSPRRSQMTAKSQALPVAPGFRTC